MRATLDCLLSLIALEHLPRTGWIQHGIAVPESVCGHVVGVAHLALALAPRVEPALDVDRVLALCLVHDSPEALTGDLPRPLARLLPEGVKHAADCKAAEQVLGPLGDLALARSREFMARETREARFAKLCDQLQLGVRLLGYLRSGQRGLESFMETLQEVDTREFETAANFKAQLLGALKAESST